MAHKIKFLKPYTINGVKYEVGKELSVSTSIYNRLIKAELAEDVLKHKVVNTSKGVDTKKVDTKKADTKKVESEK